MGEAKLRGTRDQRISAAIQSAQARREEESRAALEVEARRQRRIADRWAALSPEEKERRVAIAKREASILGHIMSLPGGRMLAATGILGHQRVEYPPDTGMADNGEVQS